MRLVVDTNILISALLVSGSLPAYLVVVWREGVFNLLTSSVQVEELMRVSRYPKIRAHVAPAVAGRLSNDVSEIAFMVAKLPAIDVCVDSYENYLLGQERGPPGLFAEPFEPHARERCLTHRVDPSLSERNKRMSRSRIKRT